MRHHFSLFVKMIVICFALAGCGGGSGSSTPQTGRATFTVVWPTRTRLIPVASNSVRIALLNGTTETATRTLVRPTEGGTSSVTFDNLQVGNFTAQATAYPQTDGTGTVQAQATVSLAVTADHTSTISLSLASTIDHLDPPFPLPTVAYNGTSLFPVTARNLANDVVLTAPETFQWQTGNTGVATVDTSGTVSGVAPGSTSLTVTETESGKSLTLSPVRVTTNAVVTVTPSSSTLSIRDTQGFASTVTGITNTAVVWSIEEGATGGTITSGGIYTAPARAGTYHVRATSLFDTTKFASVAVTVVSGSASGTIQ